MFTLAVRSGWAMRRQMLRMTRTRRLCIDPAHTRPCAMLFLIALCSLITPEQVAAQVPCALQYQPNDVDLDWNGNIPGKDRVLKLTDKSTEVKVTVSNCVGVTIKKGTVSVLWYDTAGIPHQESFRAGTTLTESILKNAQSGAPLKQLHEFMASVVSTYCSQCSEKIPGGARGTSDGVAELLQSAFSGVLVVEPIGIKLPLRIPALRSILSFKIRTGDITRRVVDGIALQEGILLIPPAVLVGGRSYVWEADIREADHAQSYTGRFVVADDVRTIATLASLTEIRKASQGQISSGQEAAYYFDQGLKANATIAMIQELSALRKDE